MVIDFAKVGATEGARECMPAKEPNKSAKIAELVDVSLVSNAHLMPGCFMATLGNLSLVRRLYPCRCRRFLSSVRDQSPASWPLPRPGFSFEMILTNVARCMIGGKTTAMVGRLLGPFGI
jgi:hypothetical protein